MGNRRIETVLAALLALLLDVIIVPSVPAQAGPMIEDVQPTSGPPGTVVHVSGRRFATDAAVSIAGQTLPVVARLPNRISVRIAESAPSGHIVVTGSSGSVRGPEFRVTPAPPAPVIESIDPPKGPPGTRVAIKGRNFSSRLAANAVTLSGQQVLVRSATPTALDITVPDGAKSGPLVVRVEQAGEVAGPSFEVAAATVIDAISPERAAPHGELTIRGQGFSSVPDQNRVFLGNVRLAVKSAGDRELRVALPGKVASGELLVDVQGAGRARWPTQVLVQLPPTVASFSPRAGRPGAVVTVHGTNFGTSAEAVLAKVGNAQARVRKASNTVLELEIPPDAKSDRLSIRVHGIGPAWSEHPIRVERAP